MSKLRNCLILLLAFLGLSALADDPTITVSARQRYPWNGLVDLTFTVTGTSGMKYDTSFTARDVMGNTNITMRTIRKADGTVAAATEQLLPGTYSWVWDAAADLPKDWQCDRVTVTGTAVEMTYYVKFNANGGTGTMSNESFTYGTAKALTANTFTRAGYTFQGWATSASGAKVYNDEQSVSNLTETSGAEVNLYAVWNAISYSVKFNANGGTGSMSNESFTYGTAKALTANAFTRTGYTFQGWATSASGAKVYNDKQSVSNLTETSGAVVNLYAVWKAPLYMVIDLSSGSSSSSYPVSFLDAVPSGGWGNTYKTTKLVLRRIEKGTFKMGGSTSTTLSKPFFCGVFEVTQKQYSLVTGSTSQYDKWPCSDSYNAIRGTSNGAKWPSASAVDSTSFMGKLRARTGLNFDLPTEAQWEYACRAGTTTTYSYGNSANGNYMVYRLNSQVGTTMSPQDVGSKLSNPWGLYDMHGNKSELCLDWYADSLSGGTDPKGASSGSSRVNRGGNYQSVESCTSSYRSSCTPSTLNGFRLTLTLSN